MRSTSSSAAPVAAAGHGFASLGAEAPCFICGIANGEPEYRESNVMIYENAEVPVFLALGLRAVQQVVSTERLYILSLGSQQGNWHVAPLSPAVPYAEQQLAALNMGRGLIAITPNDMEKLAAQIRHCLVVPD